MELARSCYSTEVTPENKISDEDQAIVAHQLGRLRYQPLKVWARCAKGYPTVVEAFHSPGPPDPKETVSTSKDWISCPWLEARIQRLEQEGWLHHLRWILTRPEGQSLGEDLDSCAQTYTNRLKKLFDARHPGLFASRYGERTLGVGGTQDPRGLKCLHNHAAFALTGAESILGQLVLALVDWNLEGQEKTSSDCGRDCVQEGEAFGLGPFGV